MKNAKALVLVLIPCVLTTACVPAAYSLAAASRHRRESIHHTALTAPPPLPIGRWDNVMMLELHAPVKVLMTSGGVTTGEFIAANVSTLRIGTATGEVVVAATDVMRVDRLAGSGSEQIAREGAKGALLGAGAVGLAGLLVGHVPPPRLFAGGSILGAYYGATAAATVPGPGTVYLAPSVAPTPAPAGQSGLSPCAPGVRGCVSSMRVLRR